MTPSLIIHDFTFLSEICKLSYKVIHSTTKLLHEWQHILEQLKLVVTNLLQDVATRWNSMFNMLEYALKHEVAMDIMTQGKELGLRQ